MDTEKYPNTIGAGAREYITGIEHLESLLDPDDTYNMHDSRIPWYHFDNEERKLDVEIWVLGSMYDCTKDKEVFIHFCFEDVVALSIDMSDWCDIYAMCLTVENNFLVCDFDSFYMKVWAKHLTISPVELRDSIHK